MKIKISAIFLLAAYLLVVCTGCSGELTESGLSSPGISSTPAIAEPSLTPTVQSMLSDKESSTAAPAETIANGMIPALDIAEKPRLSELSGEDLIAILTEYGCDFPSGTGENTDPADHAALVEELLREVREIEADPYGWWAFNISYPAKKLFMEQERRAVCSYYGWPLIRLVLEGTGNKKTNLAEFELWSLPEAYYGRKTYMTENGIQMVFSSPSVLEPDFRRKMTIVLEPAEIIDMAEAAEDPAAKRASGPEGAFFRDGVFVIYDYGDHAYKVYLRAEKFSAAVKIEASMTEEELADLISHCRFFEIVE